MESFGNQTVQATKTVTGAETNKESMLFNTRAGDELPEKKKNVLDKAFEKYENVVNPTTSRPLSVQCQKFTPHPTEKMFAGEWHGSKDVRLVERPRPSITESHDAIVDITTASICGTDLHVYNNQVPGVDAFQKGDILGHEGIGIVREIGPNVKNIKVGDRVVISAVISCGACEYCAAEEFSMCDTTNPSAQQELLYGHRIGGLFGNSHMAGGYAGLQAEVARVPFADVNLCKIPDTISDEHAVLLGDIMCTAWHSLRLGEANPNDIVAVWGAGPVGLLTGYLAKHVIKAKRVIMIDQEKYRLEMAQKIGCETVNFAERDTIKQIQDLIPGGPSLCIDDTGFRFAKSLSQKIMYKLGMEQDAIDTIKEMITVCKKAGKIVLIGEYFGNANAFPIGALMMKSITLRGGPVYCQKYWKELIPKLESGEIDCSWLFSHSMPLEDLSRAYEIFNNHDERCTKIILKTKSSQKSHATTSSA